MVALHVVERTRFPVRSEAGKALSAWGLLLLEGFGEALQSQVVVPHPGDSLVLLMQASEVNVVVADNGAAPLIDAYTVVSVIDVGGNAGSLTYEWTLLLYTPRRANSLCSRNELNLGTALNL